MLTSVIDFKNNSLNTFRLIAAINVLWAHSLTHLELQDIPFLGKGVDYFNGVPIFFTMSGFLIWQSIGRSHSYIEYAKKRFWRIYPELWAAVVIELVVLLLLYHQPINWPQFGLFAIGQATIFQFWTPECLRGYGCGTPNGALWTIAVLIQFYFLAYFFYKWLKNKILLFWGAILASVIVAWLNPQIRSILPDILAKLYSMTLIPYLWMFLIAALASEYVHKLLPFMKRYWWIFIIMHICLRYFIQIDLYLLRYPMIGTLLLISGILGFAYAFPRLNIKTDISYGIYIYHMTVVNALIAMGFSGQQLTLWVVIILTCFFAWISTITIGRLSIKKKKTLS